MIVPVHGRIWGEPEHTNLTEVINSNWYTAGPWCHRFERMLAEYIGVRHVCLCNSGSSANLLAISALDLQPGDEVITTAVNFPTTVSPILQVGAIPVYVDVTLPSMTVDVDQLYEAISPRTRAVVLAHPLGYPFNLPAVREFCDKYDLRLVEDCCDALGAKHGQKQVGAGNEASSLSFYPAHQLAVGEGGAVATNSARTAKVIRSLRDWGRDCWCEPGRDNTCGRRYSGNYDHKYTYARLGYHLQATEFVGAVGVAQMERLDGFIEKRRDNHAYLWAQAQYLGLEEHFILPEWEKGVEPSWFGFALISRGGVDRNKLCKWLDGQGVGNRPVFGGNLLRQPAFRDVPCITPVRLDKSEMVHRWAFWIGCWPGLEQDQLDYAIEKIAEYANG